MTDKKISELGTITQGDIAPGDWVAVVDSSENATKKFDFSVVVAAYNSFDNVTSFFDSTDTFTAGTIVSTRAEGFAYRAVDTATATTVANAGGQVFEVLPCENGYNVKAFGAKGDSSTDDSAAFKKAMLAAVTNRTWDGTIGTIQGGWCLFVPAGGYVIAETNVFGQFASAFTGNQIRWGNIIGTGQGSTTIYFRPTTNTSAYGDDQYYLYDGGITGNQNPLEIIRLRFRDISIELDAANLAGTDEIGAYRSNNAPSSNVEFQSCVLQGCGDIATKSIALDIGSDLNQDTNRFTYCELRRFTHLLRSASSQAVSNVFDQCVMWDIFGSPFLIDGGGMELHVNGGSAIWITDFPLLEAKGSGTGTNTHRCTFVAMKAEMRGSGSALVKSDDLAGPIEVDFISCNFMGGGISGVRDVTTLDEGQNVNFIDCSIPDEFRFAFVSADTNAGGLVWQVKTGGLVTLERCAFQSDMSESFTKVGELGRVVARNCVHIGGNFLTNPEAWDFDTNPFDCGPSEFGPETKTAIIKHGYMLWTGTKTFQTTLPYGARLMSVEAYFPGTGSGGNITLTIEDGDATVLATETADENAGHFILQEVTGANRVKSRTTATDRVIKASFDTMTGAARGGYVLARYI